ncbi:NADH dehydrogenase 21 kDa subunit [Thelephora ganbajun]|uniref:NADH dehydrogenase 21 kDa subunit n=1 Tax=Thelephora ganbajun TaxID=370292 RepID=A0ACB6ZNE6_THEGA|nr:NADH dehydrogenase 21 kDa subunit [Thelephora ganbajun]
MASKKLADSTLYHASPKGFWKKFRDATVVNPEISSGLPIPSLNRYPQPGSRPEKYSTPATKASDPAENPYWKRDVRRAFPKLSVVTQPELSAFLLQTPEKPACAYLPNPSRLRSKAANTSITAASELPGTVPLTQAISTIASRGKIFTESNLPPKLPTSYPRWNPTYSEDAPHDPNSYFPMKLIH